MTNESDCTRKTPQIQAHWDAAYLKTTTEQLGWYEDKAMHILALLEATHLSKEANILNVGAGTSRFVDDLISMGYSNVIVNDISAVALEHLQSRIIEASSNITYIQDNLVAPKTLQKLVNIDLWIDRAVLHFFLKKEEQQAYFNLLRTVIAPNGFVIIAVFSLDGASKCCGLDLQRYNEQMLQDALGSEFQLIQRINDTFINPYGGERPYVYTLFQRIL